MIMSFLHWCLPLMTIKFDLIKADSARRNQKPVTLRGKRLEIEIRSNIIY